MSFRLILKGCNGLLSFALDMCSRSAPADLLTAGEVDPAPPGAPRADFMLHTDGIFAEDSYMDDRMHLLALLGAGGRLTWGEGGGRRLGAGNGAGFNTETRCSRKRKV